MNITICLVAYTQKFTETESFKALENLSDSIKKKLNLTIFDNGAMDYTAVKPPVSFCSLTYIYNHQEERGTRIAYEISLARTEDEWLMLLDDDTSINESYLISLLKELEEVKRDEDIVAYCARVYDGEMQISPTDSETLNMLLFPKEAGVYKQNISGISSTLLVNKAFIEKIGGFSKEFSLDYLDHWIFSKIISNNKKIKVLQDKINHQLSVQNLTSLSKERFYSIFSSEYKFYKNYKPNLFCQLKRKYGKMVLKGLLKRNSGIRWKILLKIILQAKKE